MISVEGLRKRYPGETADVLSDVYLQVDEGEFVAIVGPSGSGKSTLLHILGGLDTHFEGSVQVAGTSLAGMSDKALSYFRNHTVGFVFQSFHLIPNVSALENVLLPSHFSLLADLEPASVRAKALLDKVGLIEKSHLLPSQLSGGERQRVAIARALFMKPRILLCDEPTGNLDAATGAGVIELFQSLNQENLTVVSVTHEDAMRNAASRVVEFRSGRLHEALRALP